MPISVTWQQDQQPAQQFTISDSALSTLEQYRQSQTKIVDAGTTQVPVPVYSSLIEMVVGIFTTFLLRPAFTAFPTADVQNAAAAAASAKASLESAQANALTSALATQSK